MARPPALGLVGRSLRVGIRLIARPLIAVALLLAACAAEPPPPVEFTEPPPVSRPSTSPVPVALGPREPELCPRLANMMAREGDGYAQLRAAPVGRQRWQAASVLPGVERCTVEGEAWPRARVSCSSHLIGRSGRDQILDRFEAMADRIDACLKRGFWFPRTWRRGRLFEFAMDERQLAWVDEASVPPSTVVLKVQQDLESQDYLLKVNLETLR